MVGDVWLRPWRPSDADAVLHAFIGSGMGPQGAEHVCSIDEAEQYDDVARSTSRHDDFIDGQFSARIDADAPGESCHAAFAPK